MDTSKGEVKLKTSEQYVAEVKMEGKRHRGRPTLRWKDTGRRDMKAWKILEEWATNRERWEGLCKTHYPEQGDASER